MSDKLQEMWNQQEDFVKLLIKERNFPQFPVNLSSKEGQKFIKNLTHECMHELFEANQKLKNSKDHRITNCNEFNKEEYVEELTDALHYFFEIVIMSGISLDELFQKYIEKGQVNIQRIKTGY